MIIWCRMKEMTNFIDFDKPTVCEKTRLIVYGTFKSTIILSNFLDAEVRYFLRYNEKMKISFFKKIDFSVYAKNAIGIYCGCSVTIVLHMENVSYDMVKFDSCL